ncbi:MAG: hypothetical protein JNL18_13550 [Planctomycetaceae bacterium]|nr:hypothetical protein [Planctomycetaceae bacterium]
MGAPSGGFGLLVGGARLAALFPPMTLEALAEEPEAKVRILRVGMIELFGVVPGLGTFVVDGALDQRDDEFEVAVGGGWDFCCVAYCRGAFLSR